MQKNLHLLAGGLIVFLGSLWTSGFAQQEWAKKPFTQWSKDEAEAVLNDSPWTSQQEVRIRFDKENQVAAGSYSGISATSAANAQTEVGRDIPVDFVLTLRLRSALPIRQALVRLRQLDVDRKKTKNTDRASFDAQTKGLLECPACTGNYVVTLSSKSKNSPGADAVYGVFKGGRLADLQRYIYIANERGDRRSLVHFVAPKVPGDEAIFFFSRLNDKGAPLLTPENKDLLINLSDNQVNSISNFRIDVSRLILNGNVEF